jgi:pantoate--beta-alanine ligase
MQVIDTVAAMMRERARWSDGRTLALVPTMGYLHAGHLSLVEAARAEHARVAVSIFVNPAQFAPSEDLSRYPRDLPRDLAMLESAGVDVVFTPAPEDVYPAGFSTYVVPGGAVSERLEAASRPGHFRGVATVVAKLFNIVRPDAAYFGQKDAQQVAVLRRMVTDLNFPLTLRVLPTVREPDGLAMSSRNAYLGSEDRAAATVLRRALEAARACFAPTPGGEPATVEAAIQAMRDVVAVEPRATLDYADVCHPDSFAPLQSLGAPALLAIAARVGPARLIDNYLLRTDGTWETGVNTR